MNRTLAIWTGVTILMISLVVPSGKLCAAWPGWGSNSRSKHTSCCKTGSVNVHPYECNECGQLDCVGVKCIERIPICECVTGKKKVYKCKVCYECVSIPEIRYRWKKRCITKEIPCCGCNPVCITQDNWNCYGTERWDKQCNCCSELHCKSVEPNYEKLPCKYCCSRPGKTTIKVKYWSCVKEPYTVYRMVKRPVCIKQPCCSEKVEVPIVRYKCKSYKCKDCNGGCCQSNTQPAAAVPAAPAAQSEAVPPAPGVEE